MALNKVMLIGNVGNDPEIRYLDSNPQGPQGNAKVASFRLATTERFRDRNGDVRENTEWHNIVAWRSSADLVEKFIHKGSQIYVEGKLRTRQWTDQQGNKRYTTEINADNIQLLGKRPDAPQGGPDGYAGQPQGYQGGQRQGGYGTQPQGGYSGPGYQQPGFQQPGYQQQPAQSGYQQQAAPQQAYRQPAPPAQPAFQPSSQPAADAPEDDLPF